MAPIRRKSRKRAASQPSPTPFSVALVDARDNLGRSQTEIADLIGVEQVTVSSWERGSLMPRPKRLDAVAQAYGIRADKLRSLYFDASTRAA